MTDTLSPTERQRAALLLKQMQAKLDAAERRGREPIAVVGIGCRLPGGADGAEAYWAMLDAGTDAVTEVPAARWDAAAYYDPDPDAPGKMNTRWGGFLDDIDRFDAEFFGISPREAMSLDPQQRLVLEVAWRALEDAGIPPLSLAGSRSGVYLGVCTNDYARLGQGGGNAFDTYSGTGSACGVAAGRLSYTLGLQGPSLVVDTACSSSLVATHLAIQGLRNGECDLALAGGVNLVLLPDGTVTLSRLHMMAPDGRCKPFDASANGFVRGEGAGIVVLKRLGDAQAAGDRVVAVLSGSAVNQDGRSSGLTAPNGPAQEAVIKAALANAGRRPAEVAYVEAHGTGTALGDPIELNALGSVLAAGRTQPLLVGSVKSNLGHLEAAAGIAGLIKAIGVVTRRRVPPTLHFTRMNPHIETGDCPLQVAGHAMALAAGPAIAGVSSFGFSGTNAHVVVEAPPVPQTAAAPSVRGLTVLPVSARSAEALDQLRNELAASPALDRLGEVAATLALGRSAFERRLAVVAADGAEARRLLAAARPSRQPAGRSRIAFIYAGQGAQCVGMGRALYRTEAVFRDSLDRSAAILDPLLGRSLTGLMFDRGDDLDRTAFAQPALVAHALALTDLFAAWGIVPEVVMGHSLGEYAAAAASGAAPRDAVLRLVTRRGALMQALPAGGAMVAVMAGAEAVRPLLARVPGLALAADNGPAAVTLSGPAAAVDEACAWADAQGIATRRLAVSHAFHSALLDPMLDALEQAAGAVAWTTPAIPLIGNLDGEPVARLDGAYWRRHSRQPVAFAAGLRRLAAMGCDQVVEIGPQAVLLPLARATFTGALLAAGRRDDAEGRAPLDVLARLFEAGAAVDWSALHGCRPGLPVPVPGHPFRRRRFWRDTSPAAGHPLLGSRIDLPDGRMLFRGTLQTDYLGQHQVGGRAILPAASLLELAASAAVAAGREPALADIVFAAPLGAGAEFTIEIDGDDLALHGRAAGAGWTRHLTARLAAGGVEDLDPVANADEVVDPAALYDWFAAGGVHHGTIFRRVIAARRGAGIAEVRIAPLPADGHLAHPADLDAALQALAVITLGAAAGATRIPAAADRVEFGPGGTGPLTAQARFRPGAELVADLDLVAEAGRVMSVRGLRLAAVGQHEPWRDWLVKLDWQPAPAPAGAAILAAQAAAALDAAGPAVAALDDLGEALDDAARGYAAAALAAVPRAAVTPALLALYDRLVAWPAGQGTDLAALRRAYPDSVTEIALLERCGRGLADVLVGRLDPLSLLFPGDDGNVYRDSPVSRALNRAVEDAVLAALPPDGPLHLLEVGAGTGGTTDGLLSRLPAGRMAEYAFTDLAPSLLAAARARYAAYPWLRTARLDLEAEPEPEGFEAGRYDVIVAANVVHATADLVATFRRLHRLLAPGGALVLLEGQGAQGWVDLAFGLTDGWWRFADRNLRPDYPMPDRATWIAALDRAGFDAAAATAGGAFARQVVLAARRRDDIAWLVVGGQDDLTVDLARRLGARHLAPGAALPDDGFDACVFTGALSEPQEAEPMARSRRLVEEGRRLALALDGRARLVLVTAAGPDDAVLWGLGRGIAAELPALALRQIELDGPVPPARLAAELAGRDDQVRLGPDEARAVLRLHRLPVAEPSLPVLDPAARYLVTGGFGGLGLRSARWLVERGARRLVLMGRSGPTDAARAAIARLDAEVIEIVGDVSDEGQMQAALAAGDGRLAGVIHAAGTLADGLLAQLDWSRMAPVLAAKVGGAWAIDRHAPPLDFLLLYSSAVGLIGSAGQANHVAGSAYLDALARRRNARGQRTVSLAWGAWSEIGSATAPEVAARLDAAGIGVIPPDQGVRVLDWALGADEAHVGVLPARWSEFAARTRAAGPVPQVLADLVPPVVAPRPAARPAPAVARGIALADQVAAAAAEVLAADTVDPRRNLFDLGLDSLMAVELRNRLQARLNRSLPPTLLFDHPTVEALVRFLDDVPAPAAAAAVAAADGDEAIAIIGMHCRFPGGADDPAAFWQRLLDGFDAVDTFPAGRWDEAAIAGRATTRWGAFLSDVDRFDAAFFQIAPREAASMDPQQRLWLETAWHALESAGQAPDRLAGSATGVFAGICNYDYSQIASGGGRIDAWSGTGGAPSIVAGRLAYVLGLEGPAMVVDTACSSSLVAVHLACRSILAGDCRMALAGGVNLILAPSSTIALSELQMMAPDGRCKAFDARADGFVRGEGCGVVVLKRLAEAQRDGDLILAVIRGSALNQDGRSSSLTAPSGRAQEAVIRAALGRAGVAPDSVGYVEAHGTGTALGDPIEIHALKAVFGGRTAPLAIGAVKTNVGHLEAAAGMAGLVKAVLALNAGVVPPNRHLQRLNPHIELDGLAALLPGAPTPWPAIPGPRRAGVSSFGFSGTNAHIVLEQAPPVPAPALALAPMHLVLASGATAEAAAQVAAGVAEMLERPDGPPLADVAHTTVAGRAQLKHRIAVVASTRSEAAAALRAGLPVAAAPQRIAFLFTGQGAQRAGMGQALYRDEPVFRVAIDRIAAAMSGSLDVGLTDVLWGRAADRIDRTGYAQPALFAVGFALAELYRDWGIQPAAVLGHSVGEYIAAVVAGAASPEAVARLIARRGALMQALPAGGGMAAVLASAAAVTAAIGSDTGLLAIAAINGPESTVLSGEQGALDRALARLDAAGRPARPLTVSHAFHSPLLDPMLDDLERAAAEIDWLPARIPLVGNLTGAVLDRPDAGYWRRHAREPVQFAAGVATLGALGCTALLELGPQPVLGPLARRILPDRQIVAGTDEPRVALHALAALQAAGADVSRPAGRIVPLPLYPFERRRFWVDTPAPAAPPVQPGGHPLLGAALRGPGPAKRFQAVLATETQTFLADHRVRGVATLPAAAMIAMMAEAAGSGLAAVRFDGLLGLDRPMLVQTECEGERLSIAATPVEADDWRPIASGRASTDAPGAALDLAGCRARCDRPVDIAAFYAAFAPQGIDYGPAFRPMADLWAGRGEALARLVASPGLSPAAATVALLDGAFQALGAAADGVEAEGAGYLPASVEAVRLGPPLPSEVWAWLGLRAVPAGLLGDVRIAAADGTPLVDVDGLLLRPAATAERGNPAVIADIAWQAAEPGRALPLDVHFVGLAHDEAWRALGIEAAALDDAEVVLARADGDPLAACTAIHALALAAVACPRPPRLVVVTDGAAVLPGDSHVPSIAGGALFGLIAALDREHPELDAGVIDVLDPAGVAEGLRHRGQILAVRGDRVFARALTPRSHLVQGRVGLERPATGQLQDLAFQPLSLPEPGPGEVRIAVTASGLNFRDVMNALGAYPGDGGRLGGECAGLVQAIGPGVEGLAIGQAVMAVAPGCHATEVIAKAALVLPIPPGWRHEEAAAMPTVLLTAAAALRGPGALAPGMRVLVHAGTGGLGLAAIEVARRAGAEVLATAGSEAKRDHLRALGVSCVGDSRSRGFVETVMAHTGGTGVDIVLNSLSGEMIAGGFDVLRPGGRFLEVGKAGIWSVGQAASYRADVGYHRIALDEQIVDDPKGVGQMWRELMAEDFPPLPVTTFAFDEAEQAYRYMQQARHIGRVVLTRRFLDPDGAYLVTGGGGALARHVARWLETAGAGQVVLASRRTVPALDVTDAAAVARLVAGLGRPLRGIVHAAGLLDDGLLADLGPDRFARVFAPKLDGAVALDGAAGDLDFFVMMSSAAGVLGSAGQANYAAANAGLDALAWARRAGGRHALSIDWGAWAGGGMAAGRDGPALAPAAAVAALEHLLRGGATQAVVLADARVPAQATPAVPDLRQMVAEVEAGERAGLLRRVVREQAALILDLAADSLDPGRPLNEFGLDSLMAVELRNALAAAAGMALPSSLIFDYPTIEALARFLAALLDVPPPSQPVPEEQDIETLDEQALARALQEEMERAGY